MGEIDDNHPIFVAFRTGNFSEVQKLVQRNPELVNILDVYKRTPLHYATNLGTNKLVEFLIEKGAQVNTADIDYLTPLHLASINGSATIVKTLLEKGAFTNVEELCNLTPLDMAIKNDHSSVIDQLLEDIFCAMQ